MTTLHSFRIGSCRLVLAAGLLAASTAALRETNAQIYFGEARGPQDGDLFGYAMATVGDVDGDGIDDFVVGAPFYGTTATPLIGRVSVYSGATMAWIRDHDGAQYDGDFGIAVAAAGDVDGDGVADYVVGAPRCDVGSLSRAGMAVVYSGATGSVIWTQYGTSSSAFFGQSVAGVGDVDGDGTSDLLIGQVDAAAVYGFSGSVLESFSGATGAYFGDAVAACGDLDGDGKPDFLIGAPGENSATVSIAGAVHAYSAATGAELFAVYGTQFGDELGSAIAGLGDVDGDGVPDLIASGEGYGAVGSDGDVVVASGATGATIRTQRGSTGTYFGHSVAGMGDLNHDGVPDYLVGEPYGGTGLGRAVAFSGADGKQLCEFIGSAAKNTNGTLGWSVASGDFNGDGIADLLVGDPYFAILNKTKWSVVGGAYEYFGCPAWWENYGAGWAGKNGVPGLVALNDPGTGGSLSILLDNSLGAATTGLLLIGFAEANILTGRGGTLLVVPSLTLPLPIPATGLQLNGTLPDDPALFFFEFHLQALEVDASATKGLSFTPGLTLHCGYEMP